MTTGKVQEIERSGDAPLPTISLGGQSFDAMERRFEFAQRIAEKLASSKLVPEDYRGRPDDVFVAIQMGAELGMGPFQSVQSIAVVKGKPAIWGDGLIGLVRASGRCETIIEEFDDETQTATCRTRRKGESQMISASFSHADAVKAGLLRANPSEREAMGAWYKYERRMLQMRARSWCLRDAYPDVLKGLHSAEEVMDIPQPPMLSKGDVIETEAVTVEAADDKLTLGEVLKGINEATDMPALLLAGDMAKRLWAKGDQSVARQAYRERRDMLKAALDSNDTKESEDA